MKRFLILLLLLPTILLAFTVPTKPTGFVQDYAKMLSAEQISALELKLENFERQTTNEIAVVTISSLDGDIIENVAQNIFTKWGIGKKDKNNGSSKSKRKKLRTFKKNISPPLAFLKKEFKKSLLRSRAIEEQLVAGAQ